MTGVKLLEHLMKERGVSPTQLSAACGISTATFYSRKANVGDFTASEIRAITIALRLTREERDAIFFED